MPLFVSHEEPFALYLARNRATQPDLRPAATLDLTRLALGPDDSLAVYLTNEGTESRPVLLPIPRGEATASVPEGVRLLVLKMRHSLVVDVSEELIATREKPTVVPAFAPLAADRAHLLAWIEFRAEARDPDAEWRKIGAPEVVLAIGGRRFAPVIPPRAGYGSDGALMLFRDIPLGDGVLTAGGGTWTRDQLPIDAPRSGVIVPRRGATIAPATALTVRWSGEAMRSRPDDDCAAKAKPPRFGMLDAPVRLLTCDGDRCRDMPPPSVDQRVATFEGVPPGRYTIVIGDQSSDVTLRLGEQLTHDVDLQRFRVHGRVTMDGSPIRARLQFSSGSAVTEADGRYDADLGESPRDVPVEVLDCVDGRLLQVAVPAHPLAANEPYDIDIRRNRIRVSVVDAESGRGVEGASVQLAALKSSGSDDADFVTGTSPATDQNGAAEVTNVLTNHPLVVCATAERYERMCSRELSLASSHDVTVTVALHSKSRFEGHIRSVAPIQSGRIYFVGPDARIREWSPIEADGTFVHRLPHVAPEYAVVVSTLPLLVTALGNESVIDITLPMTNVRDVEVAIKTLAQRDGLITLFVGDRQIPQQAFAWHQTLRYMQPILFGGGPLRIPQVLETGPIAVGLGPSPRELPELAPDADLCAIPGFAACRRKTLAASNTITF